MKERVKYSGLLLAERYKEKREWGEGTWILNYRKSMK